MLQFTTDRWLTNLYVDDSIIYASGDNIPEVKQKLQNCIKSSWHQMYRLKNNINKTKVMFIGSKAQSSKTLNVDDDFILSYYDTPLELVENAKYIPRYVCKLWYLMGFPCAASLSNYILPCII